MVSIQQSIQKPTGAHNLPGQLAPFVGRRGELAEISDLLANPACRLLTLIGPGGIGKTRLAIQAAGVALDHCRSSKILARRRPIAAWLPDPASFHRRTFIWIRANTLPSVA